MITLKVDGIPELQAELKAKVNPKKISHSFYQGILRMESRARLYCPVGLTHRLTESIVHYPTGEGSLTYTIAATAPYADAIEYGTMAHMIYPKNKKVLHWVKDGMDYFSTGVYHPGIKVGSPENPLVYTSTIGKYPSYRPFLRSAVYDEFPNTIRMIEASLNEK